MRRTQLTSLFLSALLLAGAIRTAVAHAELIRSSPAEGERLADSPPQVKLWFNEELSTRESTVKVFDEDGKQVDSGDGYVDLSDPDHASMIVSLPPLPEGVYTVRWRAVTPDDSGVTEGEFAFFVGAATPRPEASPAIPPQTTPPLSGWLWAGLLALGAVILLVVVGLAARRKQHGGS